MGLKSTHDAGLHDVPGANIGEAHTLRVGLADPPRHDAKRWGAPLSNEDVPQRLIRLADLVRMVCIRTGIESVQWCAAKVLAKLAEGGPLRLFVLQLGPLASLVPDDELWRPSYPSGPDKWSARQREMASGVLRALWCLSDEEAQARGIKSGCRADLIDDEMQALPELPELRGPAGALALMQAQWADQAQTFDDLDTGPLASLAMVAADSVVMFADAPAAEGVPIADDATQAGATAGRSAKTLPADAIVLAEWNKLNTKGGKPTATLMARYGVSADTIQRAKNRAKAAISKVAKRGTAANPFGSTKKAA